MESKLKLTKKEAAEQIKGKLSRYYGIVDTDATPDVDVLLGAATIIDLTPATIKVGADLEIGDKLVIVYETRGDLKIAQNIYIWG